MHPEQTQMTKRPFGAAEPFPWQCHRCGENKVVLATIEYAAEVRHDGRLHEFTIPRLEIPVCQGCGEKVFTEDVDRQVNDALRSHLKVFTPTKIREVLGRLNLSQKEVADRLGIAEATISRWLGETQIQSKSMDRLLRVFFAFPQVRAALCGELMDPDLGVVDIVTTSGSVNPSERPPLTRGRRRRSTPDGSWSSSSPKRQAGFATAQRLVQSAGSTWHTRINI